jgi:hypothetical protein
VCGCFGHQLQPAGIGGKGQHRMTGVDQTYLGVLIPVTHTGEREGGGMLLHRGTGAQRHRQRTAHSTQHTAHIRGYICGESHSHILPTGVASLPYIHVSIHPECSSSSTHHSPLLFLRTMYLFFNVDCVCFLSIFSCKIVLEFRKMHCHILCYLIPVFVWGTLISVIFEGFE